MVVEVKGGGIGFNGSDGEWSSIDRDGVSHHIKDPVEQARSSKHELFKKLRDLPGWDDRWLTVAHAVSFPDIYWKSNLSKPDLSPEIVLDAAALKDLENAISCAFSLLRRWPERRFGLRPARAGREIISPILPDQNTVRR